MFPGGGQCLVESGSDERVDVEWQVLQVQNYRPNRRARFVRELRLSDLIDLRPAFDRHGSLEDALLIHLAGEEDHWSADRGAAQCHCQG